jgi:hypothetical protein
MQRQHGPPRHAVPSYPPSFNLIVHGMNQFVDGFDRVSLKRNGYDAGPATTTLPRIGNNRYIIMSDDDLDRPLDGHSPSVHAR